MTLWRLHWLRLTRTARLWTLLGLYVFFGVTGPLSARYINEIIARAGGGLKIEAPDPTPLDGMLQFVGNAGQLGVLAIVIVAAGALAIDSRPEWGAFLRTRVPRSTDLVVPAVVVTSVAAVVATALGTGIAWLVTDLLLGALDAGDVLVGLVLSAVYVAFVVAVTAATAATTRSTLSTVLVAIGVLIGLPVLALLPPVEPWIPSELLGAPVDLLVGRPLSELLRATATAIVAIPALTLWASRRLAGREL